MSNEKLYIGQQTERGNNVQPEEERILEIILNTRIYQ
jgi:hypothetical protein